MTFRIVIGCMPRVVTATAERYDLVTNSWTAITSMGTARYGLGLTTL